MEHFVNFGAKHQPILIIFPHAGAMPLQYINWAKKYLADEFNLFIAKKITKASCWDELCQLYSQELTQQLPDEPLLIFGHSMGGLISNQIIQSFSPTQSKLVLSAIAPPDKNNLNRYQELAEIPSQGFVTKILEFGGIPQELAQQPELLMRYAEEIQADFKLLATIQNAEDFKLNQDIYAVGSLQDRVAPINELQKWKSYTSTNFHLKIFSGNHFYLFDNPTQVKDYLLELMIS